MKKEVQIIAPVVDRGSSIRGKDSSVKKRAAAYARVSTDSDEQGVSFDNQVETWTNFIKSQPDLEFVKVYTDKGKSGTSIKKRTGFSQMIQDATDGKIDIIYCKSISRFARNTVVSVETVRMLRTYGVDVYFDNERLSTLDPKNEFTLTVLALMAQEESRHISENVLWTFNKKMKNGEPFICSSRFLGYDLNESGDQLVINQAQAIVVKLIFNLYDSGKGCYQIANELMERGYKTVLGNTFWHTSTIIDILRNEKYCGDLLLQKTYTVDYLTHERKKNNRDKQSYYIKDAHEPIVSREQWNRVQEKLKAHYDDIFGEGFDRSKHNNRYPMSGAMVCLGCGSTYKHRFWNSNHETAKRGVYQCTSYVIGNEKGEKCHGVSLSEGIANEICCDVINRVYLKNSKIFTTISKAIQKTLATDEIQSEKRRLSKIRESLIGKIDRILKDRIEVENTELKVKIDKQYHQLLDQYEGIDAELNIVIKRETTSMNAKKRLEKMLAILGKKAITPNMLTRETVDVFFYKIFVAPDNELIFVIDTTKSINGDELIAKRQEISHYDPIYKSEKIDTYSRFKPTIKYKVVLV